MGGGGGGGKGYGNLNIIQPKLGSCAFIGYGFIQGLQGTGTVLSHVG